jgi:hypothetical protein
VALLTIYMAVKACSISLFPKNFNKTSKNLAGTLIVNLTRARISTPAVNSLNDSYTVSLNWKWFLKEEDNQTLLFLRHIFAQTILALNLPAIGSLALKSGVTSSIGIPGPWV